MQICNNLTVLKPQYNAIMPQNLLDFQKFEILTEYPM